MPSCISRHLRRFVVLFACLGGVLPAAQGNPLPALNIDLHETSVSGLSSGAFMAVQFQLAYSSIVKGAGIVAGGPFFCSQGDALRATTRCSCTFDPEHKICVVSPTSAEVPALLEKTRQYAANGLIDNPAGLARQRVLILSGSKDETVPPLVSRQLAEFYEQLGLAPENLSSIRLPNAAHTMPTLGYGAACDVSQSPFLGKCGYDAAGKILSWIYGPLKAPAAAGKTHGKLLQFDQALYQPPGGFAWTKGLDSSGWVYVPEACARGATCRVHIALHGCKQGQSFLPIIPPVDGGLYYGTTFVRKAGYQRWADSNNIVVLYPQAVSMPYRNPNGCWDWWGYGGADFATNQGAQLTALRAMVEQLASGKR